MVENLNRILKKASFLNVEDSEVVKVLEEEYFVLKLDQLGMVHVLVVEGLHNLKFVVRSRHFLRSF